VPEIIVIGHLLLKLLYENVVTCFLWDTVYFQFYWPIRLPDQIITTCELFSSQKTE